MNRFARALPLLLAMAPITGTAFAAASGSAAGAITVERPWSRATPGGATVAGGYLTVRNDGDAPDRLVSATSEVADRVGPHSMTMTGGVMRMRPLPDGITVPAHGSAVLSPAGDHLMFEGLKRSLRQGERFSGTLTFQHAGAVAVTFTVESIGAKGPAGAPAPDGGHDMKMNGMKMD